MNKVTVIIVTYNSEKTIIDCLKSIYRQKYCDFKTKIVDNNSTDQTVSFAETVSKRLEHPLKIINLFENIGFAEGNNKAFNGETSEYIALVNPDMIINEIWLEELVCAMYSNVSIGICASKIVVHNTAIIDTAGDGYSKTLKGFKCGEGFDVPLFDFKQNVFGACAGAALYRREMLEEIGFFDEDFFLIHEDTDLNFRAQLAGWKVMYVPTAIAHHKVRSSIGIMSDLAVYYSLRNSELVRIKNVPLGIFLRYLPWFIISEISEFIYFAIKHRHFRLFLKAKRDALKMLPLMLKKRKKIMKNKKVSNKYIMSIMTPIWQKNLFLSKIRKFIYG